MSSLKCVSSRIISMLTSIHAYLCTIFSHLFSRFNERMERTSSSYVHAACNMQVVYIRKFTGHTTRLLMPYASITTIIIAPCALPTTWSSGLVQTMQKLPRFFCSSSPLDFSLPARSNENFMKTLSLKSQEICVGWCQSEIQSIKMK